MSFASLNIPIAFPEIFLLAMTLVIMLVDLFSAAEERAGRLYFLSIGTLLLVAYSLAYVPQSPSYAFSRMFVLDGMAAILKFAIEIGRAHV